MKNSDIVKEILKKYSNINETDRKSIVDYFHSLPEQKSNLYWNEIKNNYTNDFPTLAKLRQFLLEAFPESYRVVDLSGAAFKCKVCGLIYSNKSDRMGGIVHCPRCGENYVDLIADAQGCNIVFAQDHCFMCPLFEENERGVYGPLCELYGSGKPCSECVDCKCKPCCHNFTTRREIYVDTPEERKEKQAKADWRDNKKKIISLSKDADKFAEDILKRRNG